MNRPRLIVVVILTTALCVSAGWAHKHPCSHTHNQPFPDDLISCNVDDAPCEDVDSGVNGQCKQIQQNTRAWCECAVPRGDGDGGCMATSSQVFSDQGDGAPASNSSRIYLAVGDERNNTTVSFGNTGGVDFIDPVTGVQGTFTLFFGSFSDPLNVPVTVEDVSLTLPDIGGQGIAWFELPDGAFQGLTYDSTTGVISTHDELGIELWLSTDWGWDQHVRVYLEGVIEPGGMLGFAQGEAPFPVFGDNFDSGTSAGTTDDWSSTMGLMAALLGLSLGG